MENLQKFIETNVSVFDEKENKFEIIINTNLSKIINNYIKDNTFYLYHLVNDIKNFCFKNNYKTINEIHFHFSSSYLNIDNILKIDNIILPYSKNMHLNFYKTSKKLQTKKFNFYIHNITKKEFNNLIFGIYEYKIFDINQFMENINTVNKLYIYNDENNFRNFDINVNNINIKKKLFIENVNKIYGKLPNVEELFLKNVVSFNADVDNLQKLKKIKLILNNHLSFELKNKLSKIYQNNFKILEDIKLGFINKNSDILNLTLKNLILSDENSKNIIIKKNNIKKYINFFKGNKYNNISLNGMYNSKNIFNFFKNWNTIKLEELSFYDIEINNSSIVMFRDVISNFIKLSNIREIEFYSIKNIDKKYKYIFNDIKYMSFHYFFNDGENINFDTFNYKNVKNIELILHIRNFPYNNKIKYVEKVNSILRKIFYFKNDEIKNLQVKFILSFRNNGNGIYDFFRNIEMLINKNFYNKNLLYKNFFKEYFKYKELLDNIGMNINNIFDKKIVETFIIKNKILSI